MEVVCRAADLPPGSRPDGRVAVASAEAIPAPVQKFLVESAHIRSRLPMEHTMRRQQLAVLIGGTFTCRVG
jgi:hypothetical protein